MSQLRIMIAEDHETVREGMKMLIDAQPDMTVVGEAGDGLTAIQKAESLTPDIVVMDVTMPGATGFQATEKLNQSCPQVKVLALTRHKDKAYLHELVRAGAYGYVLKQSPANELLRAIRTVAGGSRYLDPAMSDQVIGRHMSDSSQLDAARQPWISKREEQVLRLIAWGYSNKEIAADMEISVKTVEAHRANAMRKLDLHNRIDIVRFALLRGWLEEE
jgi:two-component system, NarL family, response regulator NreC